MAARLLGIGVLALLLASCSWDAREPGLFPVPTIRPTATFAPLPPAPPPPVNPALPTAGSVLWRTGDGNEVSVRFAVHAVRRMAGATVLDWSVTPLIAPHAGFGDSLPRTVDLGLSDDSDASVSLLLVDPPSGRVFRPLRVKSQRASNHCLCTPVWLAQQQLRIGETSLLQVAYPPLPPSLRTIAVAWPNSPPITGVPVTPETYLPTVATPADSYDPPAASRPAARPVVFPIPGTRHRSAIELNRVVATDGLTALVWTLESVDEQRDLRGEPLGAPVTTPPPDHVFTPHSRALNGPVLHLPGQVLPASWMTSTVYGQSGFQCLCSSVGLWAGGLWPAGGRIEVVTLYPGLTPGTTRVDVELPGVTTIRKIGVRWSVPVPAGPDQVGDFGTWTYDEADLPHAWSVTDWPTPVPDPAQLAAYEGTVDRITPPPD